MHTMPIFGLLKNQLPVQLIFINLYLCLAVKLASL